MATKKTSTKFDTADNIETEADLTNKTATVKNLVTGETYAGGGEGLPDISAGDAGKVLTVSNELAAEWAAPKSGLISFDGEKLNKSYNNLLSMISDGVIPFIFYTGYIYILGSCDSQEDGVIFIRNSGQAASLTFVLPDGDADADLIID